MKIWYHGSIVPSQFPEAVMHALTHLRPEVTLEFAGYETVGHPGYVQRLVDLARQLGIDDRVHYLGTLPDRGSLLARCSQCHVGVALFQQGTRQPMAGASNKPFDYLACGLALLVSELPEWRETYVVPGYGLACYPDDPNSIASALRWFLDHPEQTRAMGDMGRQRILDEWNYEKQFQPMCEMLNALYLPKQ